MKSLEMPSRIALLAILFLLGLVLVPTAARGIPVREPVVYKGVDGGELKLDAIKPTGSSAGDRRPAMVLVHGGDLVGGKLEKGSPAEKNPGSVWNFTPDPALPNVLILGDSISIGYTLGVRELLAGKANVFRPLTPNGKKPLNCQGTVVGVQQVERWIADKEWSVIHFNWGLHDLKHVSVAGTKKNSNKASDPVQSTVDQYRRNLEMIVGKLEATDAKLIFATTTPVAPGTINPLRDVAAPGRYNAAAMEIMKPRVITVDDLYAAVEPDLAKFQLPKNVHFKSAGSEFLARQVADSIQAALEANKTDR